MSFTMFGAFGNGFSSHFWPFTHDSKHHEHRSRIRASNLNRHGFVDVTVVLIVFQVIYLTLILLFCNVDYGVDETDSMSVGKIIFISLIIAPYFENLLLIGVAAIFENYSTERSCFY